MNPHISWTVVLSEACFGGPRIGYQPYLMDDERHADEVGTELDDGAEPSYEDGSPVESPPAPDPARPNSAIGR